MVTRAETGQSAHLLYTPWLRFLWENYHSAFRGVMHDLWEPKYELDEEEDEIYLFYILPLPDT